MHFDSTFWDAKYHEGVKPEDFNSAEVHGPFVIVPSVAEGFQ